MKEQEGLKVVEDILPEKPHTVEIAKVSVAEKHQSFQHAFFDSKTPSQAKEEWGELGIMDWTKCMKVVAPKEIKVEAKLDARVMLMTLNK